MLTAPTGPGGRDRPDSAAHRAGPDGVLASCGPEWPGVLTMAGSVMQFSPSAIDHSLIEHCAPAAVRRGHRLARRAKAAADPRSASRRAVLPTLYSGHCRPGGRRVDESLRTEKRQKRHQIPEPYRQVPHHQ